MMSDIPAVNTDEILKPVYTVSENELLNYKCPIW